MMARFQFLRTFRNKQIDYSSLWRRTFSQTNPNHSPAKRMEFRKPLTQTDQGIELFALKTINKYYEVWPLFIISAVGFFGNLCFFIRNGLTRDDVKFCKWSKYRYEETNFLKPPKRKMIIINDKYPPMPELQNLFDEMRQAEKELESASE